jgi:hypothetical protein
MADGIEQMSFDMLIAFAKGSQYLHIDTHQATSSKEAPPPPFCGSEIQPGYLDKAS